MLGIYTPQNVKGYLHGYQGMLRFGFACATLVSGEASNMAGDSRSHRWLTRVLLVSCRDL